MKPKRKMTERQAWFYLARAWRRAVDGDAIVSGKDVFALCTSVAVLLQDGLISAKTYIDMLTRMSCHKPPNVFAYWWPLNSAGGAQRAAFCRLLAILCPKPTRKAGVQE